MRNLFCGFTIGSLCLRGWDAVKVLPVNHLLEQGVCGDNSLYRCAAGGSESGLFVCNSLNWWMHTFLRILSVMEWGLAEINVLAFFFSFFFVILHHNLRKYFHRVQKYVWAVSRKIKVLLIAAFKWKYNWETLSRSVGLKPGQILRRR